MKPEHITSQPSSKPEVGGRGGEKKGREKGEGAMGWSFWVP